jgi:hypothetical protein
VARKKLKPPKRPPRKKLPRKPPKTRPPQKHRRPPAQCRGTIRQPAAIGKFRAEPHAIPPAERQGGVEGRRSRRRSSDAYRACRDWSPQERRRDDHPRSPIGHNARGDADTTTVIERITPATCGNSPAHVASRRRRPQQFWSVGSYNMGAALPVRQQHDGVESRWATMGTYAVRADAGGGQPAQTAFRFPIDVSFLAQAGLIGIRSWIRSDRPMVRQNPGDFIGTITSVPARPFAIPGGYPRVAHANDTINNGLAGTGTPGCHGSVI